MSSTRGNTIEVRVPPWRLTWWHICLNYLTLWASRSKGPLSWWPSRQFCKLNQRPTICFLNKYAVVFLAEASPTHWCKRSRLQFRYNPVGKGRNSRATPRWRLFSCWDTNWSFWLWHEIEIGQQPTDIWDMQAGSTARFRGIPDAGMVDPIICCRPKRRRTPSNDVRQSNV